MNTLKTDTKHVTYLNYVSTLPDKTKKKTADRLMQCVMNQLFDFHRKLFNVPLPIFSSLLKKFF